MQTGPVLTTEALHGTIDQACNRIAPLWSLRNFVAVNPFWGMLEKPFATVAGRMTRVAHAQLTMDRDFYRQAWEEGRITANDLRKAADKVAGEPIAVDRMVSGLNDPAEVGEKIVTVAEFLDARNGSDYADTITSEISKWCSAVFDHGQATWVTPAADQPLFGAWKQIAEFDRNPEIRGIKGFRKLVASLPEDPHAVIHKALAILKVAPDEAERFLQRELLSIAGWASYVKRIDRDDDGGNQRLVELLAVRMVFDLALAGELTTGTVQDEWSSMLALCAEQDQPLSDMAAIWQEAFEIAYRRSLLEQLQSSGGGWSPGGFHSAKAPAVQAAFCIDVRSERFRRSLEAAAPGIETIGFAGFFGFPIEYTPFAGDESSALCPVLLKPGLRVTEKVKGADSAEASTLLGLRQLGKRALNVWKGFKVSAVSSFSYVEACGLGFGPKLVSDSLGRTRAADAPFGGKLHHPTGPVIASEEEGGPDLDALAKVAAGALTNMGLTKNFARLVLLCGHGSSTTNNPYGSGLDCGACGGHGGENNARVAASVLNRADIRSRLVELGIEVPESTRFVAGRHDTTTDQIDLFDTEGLTASHDEDLTKLIGWLSAASHVTRLQRAESLGVDEMEEAVDALVISRSRDWSQVRPEWGLAGNAAFIAAPRSRTVGIPLNGRAFLHNYDHGSDAELKVLELIMCAPMVVANWINMQYFASTVDNTKFGSGSKVTHNVVGTIGVLQGNDGDLQTGLPWQSIHDGEKYVHEPIRLNVIIEAKTAAIDEIIARHETVRHLVENEWIQLIAIEPGTDEYREYSGGAWSMYGAGKLQLEA